MIVVLDKIEASSGEWSTELDRVQASLTSTVTMADDGVHVKEQVHYLTVHIALSQTERNVLYESMKSS